ncbi:MAG: helix-turn-helix domain-containing protein [Thermoleophilia bacterium]
MSTPNGGYGMTQTVALPRLLRVNEACKLAGICRSRGYEFVNDGTWPSVRIGKSVRIPLRGLEEWLTKLETEAGILDEQSAAQ